MDQRLYIVSYDIADPKRWRRVFRLMKGYGEWLQLSVFQCNLRAQQHAELVALLDGIIHHTEDSLLMIDFGHLVGIEPRVVCLGKARFEPIEHTAVIV